MARMRLALLLLISLVLSAGQVSAGARSVAQGRQDVRELLPGVPIESRGHMVSPKSRSRVQQRAGVLASLGDLLSCQTFRDCLTGCETAALR
jgi:hypothetical protein